MSYVFVPAEPLKYSSEYNSMGPQFDLSSAYEHGELVFMLPPGNAPLDHQPVIDAFESHLEHFTQDDFLLCVGSPMLVGMASAIAARQSGGRVNFLFWLRNYRRYTIVKADLGGN